MQPTDEHDFIPQPGSNMCVCGLSERDHRLARWQALYDESNEPPKPIPVHAESPAWMQPTFTIEWRRPNEDYWQICCGLSPRSAVARIISALRSNATIEVRAVTPENPPSPSPAGAS
jgi:hypothetical protein